MGSGEVFVAGDTTASLSGLAYAGGYDAFVRAYYTHGNPLWTDEFGEPSYDLALAVASTPTGLVVAGSGGGTLPGATIIGGTNMFLRSYQANGVVSWTIQFGTPTGASGPGGVAASSANQYVAG